MFLTNCFKKISHGQKTVYYPLVLLSLFCRLSKRHQHSSTGKRVQTLHDSAVFVTSRRRLNFWVEGIIKLGSNFWQKKGSLVSGRPPSRAGVRAHPSVENFGSTSSCVFLSSRLQMPQSTWGWLSGTCVQYYLLSHSQALHKLCEYVGRSFTSRQQSQCSKLHLISHTMQIISLKRRKIDQP